MARLKSSSRIDLLRDRTGREPRMESTLYLDILMKDRMDRYGIMSMVDRDESAWSDAGHPSVVIVLLKVKPSYHTFFRACNRNKNTLSSPIQPPSHSSLQHGHLRSLLLLPLPQHIQTEQLFSAPNLSLPNLRWTQRQEQKEPAAKKVDKAGNHLHRGHV